MKRLIAVMLCLALAVGCAWAEETERTVVLMIEGISEEVAERLHQSGEGFEIWYPSEFLQAGEKYGHECFFPLEADGESDTYFMIVPSDADPADAEGLLGEAVGGFGAEAEIGEVRWSTTADGSLLGSVEAREDGIVYRYYLATDEENLLLITACFPVEAAEGFGVRFDRMAETIAFSGTRLNARYEGEGFAISYPDGILEPLMIYGHDGFAPSGIGEENEISLMIVRSDVSPEHADELLSEAIGGYEDEYEVRRSEEKELAGGLSLRSVEAEQSGRIDRYYLVKGEEAVYCLTAVFPAAGETDYGALFDAMTESFGLIEME